MRHDAPIAPSPDAYKSSMSGWHIAMLVCGFVAFDAIMVSAVIGAMVSGTLGVLSRKFPSVPMLPGADYREFQDMKFGASNFGKCIHIGVDASGLHLHPARILRWAGGKPTTVPWTQVELLPEKKARSTVPCKLGGLRARIPAWCFDQQF